MFQWFPGLGHCYPRRPSVDSGRCISDTVLQRLRQRTGPGRLRPCQAASLRPTSQLLIDDNCMTNKCYTIRKTLTAFCNSYKETNTKDTCLQPASSIGSERSNIL